METRRNNFHFLLLMIPLLHSVWSQSHTCPRRISGDELDGIWEFSPPEEDNTVCPSGWVKRGTTCYRMAIQEFTWQAASDWCNSEGGELVKLEDTLETFDVVTEVMRSSTPVPSYAWTGLRISNWNNCTGEWSDGTLGGGFNGQWEPNRPREGLGDCVAVSSCDGRLTNMPCTSSLPVVCEAVACRSGDFHCTNNRCIPDDFICDEIDDCGDMSDELIDSTVDSRCSRLTLVEVPSSGQRCLRVGTGGSNVDVQYQNNDRRFFKFVAEAGKRLQLSVRDFITEAVKDRLYIYTGGSTFATSTFLDSLDEEVADGTSYISLNNQALLLFSTDADFVPNNGGFEVCATTAFSCGFSEMIGRYRQPASDVDNIDPNANTESQCRTSCLTDGECLAFTWNSGCTKHRAMTYLIPDSNAVYYRKPCPGATDENAIGQLPNGGGRLTADNRLRSASSPYYPSGQDFENLQLTWNVEAAREDAVVTITAFDMTRMGEDDVVKVYDGPAPDESRLLATYRKGHADPAFVVTMGPHATVTLESFSEEAGGGINFGYVAGCKASVYASTASFSSPGFPTGYPNLLSCEFTVTAAEPLVAVFDSSNFEIKPGDSLKIETGIPNSGDALFSEVRTINANATSATVAAPTMSWNATNIIRITMTTNAVGDDVGSGKGFSVTVSAGCSDLNVMDPHIVLFAMDRMTRVDEIPRTFNSSVFITCEPGYYLAAEEFRQCPNGDDTNLFLLQCESFGRYNAPRIPACTRRACGLPPTLINGFLTDITGVETNDNATYQCVPGLTLDGPNVSTCLNGNWTRPGECRGGECLKSEVSVPNGDYRDPDDLDNPIMFGDEIPKDTVIQFVCDPGYYLTKGYRAACKEGNWLGDTQAVCERLSCDIPKIQRGNVEYTGHDSLVPHDEEITITCDEGYVLYNTTQQTQRFTCNRGDANTMEPFGPRELVQCDDLDECKSGADMCDDICINTIGSYRCECNEGRSLENDRRSCSDINECDFLDELEQCDANDDECLIQRCQRCMNSPADGFTCDCDPGYELWRGGIDVKYPMRLNENGLDITDVLAENISCVRKTCNGSSLPTMVPGGTRITYRTNYFFNQDVEYVCDFGTSVGDTDFVTQSLKCTHNGEWMNTVTMQSNTDLLNCTAVKCAGVNLTDIEHRFGVDLVMPDLPSNYMEEFNFNAVMEFNCTIPGKGLEMRSQQCVLDETFGGYRLVGDSLECKRIDCGPIPGRSVLNPDLINEAETFYGDSFIFECQTSFTQYGSSSNGTTVQCMNNTHWDLGDLRCEGSTCPDPRTPPGAEQIPYGNDRLLYEVGSMVTYRCLRDGYYYNGTALECVVNGNSVEWNVTFGYCEDMEDPEVVECPDTVQAFETYRPFNITIPVFRDNTGIQSINSSHPLGAPVTIGLTTVEFIATDFNNNQANCTVKIEVSNPSPPMFRNCTTPAAIVLTEGESPRPMTFDNSFLPVIMDQSEIDKLSLTATQFNPPQLTFSQSDIGAGQDVTITVRNTFGEEATCTLYYQVEGEKCPESRLTEPENNDRVGNSFTCKNDHIFAGNEYIDVNNGILTYSCDSSKGDWVNDHDMTSFVPDCVPFTDEKVFAEITITYTAFVGGTLQGAPPPNCIAAAESHNFENSAESFVISEGLFATPAANGDCDYDLDDVTSSAGLSTIGDTIEVKLRFLMSKVDGVTNSLSQERCRLDMLNIYRTEYTNREENLGVCTIRSNSDSATIDSPVFGDFCSGNGEVLYGDMCAQCGRGFFKESDLVCTKCPIGEYQNELGQPGCKPCAMRKSTKYRGAKSIGECLDECPPGYTSDDGLSPCTIVPSGSYWVNSTTHLSCPDGTDRTQAGGRDINACTAECGPGYYSATGYAPCRACPRGYYQGGVQNTDCEECTNGTTITDGATSAGHCIDNITLICAGPDVNCNGNGECVLSDNIAVCNCFEGFSGIHCDISLDPCASNPCYNNGRCTPDGASFNCTCFGEDTSEMRVALNNSLGTLTDVPNLPAQITSGVIINHARTYPTYQECFEFCEMNDDCNVAIWQSDDDPTSGGCYTSHLTRIADLTMGGMVPMYYYAAEKETQTESFYNGPRCETLITDPCEGNTQCANNASCHTLGHEQFECLCPTGAIFTGDRCNITKPICEIEPCENGGTCREIATFRRVCDCPLGYETQSCGRPIDFCTPNPCLYSGGCTIDLNEPSGFVCDCQDGYNGERCETPPSNDLCAMKPCGGRECYLAPDTSLPACVCDEDERLNPNGDCVAREICDENPCFNNGTCEPENSSPSGFRCVCPQGYRGAQCQEEIPLCDPVEGPCDLDHSECVVDVNRTEICTCDPGYTGMDCTMMADLCVPNPCNTTNTQMCFKSGQDAVEVNDYKCVCKVGFTGRHCDVIIDACYAEPCVHGQCQNDGNGYNCVCDPGWTGSDCDGPIDECDPNPCGMGSCFTLFNGTRTCACIEGQQYGEQCEHEINACAAFSETLCGNRGQCMISGMPARPVCNCDPGQSGSSCQCQRNFCAADNAACMNGGTCTTLPTDFKCTCRPGFTGKNCQTNIDDCGDLAGCTNCVDGVETAYCRCGHGRTGVTCNKNADYDYDLRFTGIGGSELLFPAKVNSTAFTIVVFVRSEEGADGMMLQICRAQDETVPECRDPDSPLLEIDGDNLYVGGDRMTPVQTDLRLYRDRFWRRIIITVDGSIGELQLSIDGTRRNPVSDGDLRFDNPLEFVHIILGRGGDFRGSIYRLEVYDYLPSDNDRALIGNNMPLPKPPCAPWDFYDLRAALYVNPSTYSPGGNSGSGGTRDPVPVAEVCPAFVYERTEEDERGDTITFTTRFNEGVVDRNYQSDSNLDVGAYDGIARAVNGEGSFTECRFPIYISYDTCEDLKNTESVNFTCVDFVNDLYKSCTPECKDPDFVFLNAVPNKINCGPLGVFDPYNPTSTFQISECGRLCGSLFNVTFSWNYTVIIPLGANSASDMEEDFKTLMTIWDDTLATGICDSSCSNVDIDVKYESPDVPLTVEITVDRVSPMVVLTGDTMISTESAIRQAVLQDRDLDVTANAVALMRTYSNIRIQIDSFEYSRTITCTESGCQPRDEDEYCVQCTAGTFLNITTQRCEPCAKGFYQNTPGQERCEPCANTKTTERDGARSQDACFEVCPPGYHFDKNNGTCMECGFGFYQGETAQTFCHQCEAGETTLVKNATNSSQCTTACESGEELDVKTNDCIECPQGTYRTKNLHAFCIPCGGDRTTLGPGAEFRANCSVARCSAGEYRVGHAPGTCLPCRHGHWRSDDMNATICEPCLDTLDDAEMYTTVDLENRDMEVMGATNYSQCRAFCPEGKYLNESTGACMLCPKDTYKDRSVNESIFDTECISCMAPKLFTLGEGSTSAAECKFVDCGPGQMVNTTDPDNPRCTDCPVGEYQPVRDPTNHTCLPCENMGGLQTSTLGPGSGKTASDCIPYCDAGMELIGDTCEMCLYGFYKNNSGSHAALFDNCTECEMGWTTRSLGSTSSDNCSVPDCGRGHFLNDSNECQACDIGFYQDETWRDRLDREMPFGERCKMCRSGTSTVGEGSVSVNNCSISCPSGQEDVNGTCMACVKGYYKDNSVSQSAQFGKCTKCDEGNTTAGPGSISADNCSIPVCVPGQFLDEPANLCMPCHKGSYNELYLQTQCMNCTNDDLNRKTSTVGEGSTSADNCTVRPNTRRYRASFTLENSPSKQQMMRGGDDWVILRMRVWNFLVAVIRDDIQLINFVFVANFEAFYVTRGSTVLTADFEADSTSDATMIPMQIQNDINSALVASNPVTELMDLINTPGENGVLGEAVPNFGSVQSIDNVVPENCTAGQTLMNGVCVVCPVNFTYEAVGAICSKCPDGTRTNDTGKTSVEDCLRFCPAGFEATDDKSGCKACPVGKYKANDGEDECTECGQTADGNPLTTRQEKATSMGDCVGKCGPGRYYSTSNDICVRCKIDMYNPDEIAEECRPCDVFHTTIGESSDAVDDCKPVCGPNIVDPDHQYCMNGATCEWNEAIKTARCICEDPYEGERCQTRGEPSSNTNVILAGVFGALGGILLLLMIILSIRWYFVRKQKREEHEDRKKAIRAGSSSVPYGPMPAPVVAPTMATGNYYGGTYAPAEDALSHAGYMPGYGGVRQAGRPTPPGTLHGFHPTYAHNPAPSLYGTANPSKAVYYDEKEPDYRPPTYGTQGYTGGGMGLYGTNIYNTDRRALYGTNIYNTGGSVFQGNR